MHVITTLVGLVAALSLPWSAAADVKLCKNHGLEYAIYANDQPQNTNVGYPDFDPTVYKTVTPIYGNYTGFRVSHNQVIKKLKQVGKKSRGNFVVNFRGYIYAPATGVYTVKMENIDDVMFFWYNAPAYAGWTRGNALLTSSYNFPSGAPGSAQTSMTLTAGKYYAFRVLYAEKHVPWGFNFAILDPSGNTILGGRDDERYPAIRKQGCFPVENAPWFLPFGAEV